VAQIQEIGVVKSGFKESADPFEMRKHESTILINEGFEEGLFRIEENQYIQVLFHFHRSSDYTLKGRRYQGRELGVFASRSPRRPGGIGLTTVELLNRDGRKLVVRGLDALDGTPVLDLKPYTPGLDGVDEGEVEEDFIRRHPRSPLLPLVKNRDLKALLLKAGQFHGHFCPGISLGVMAAVYGLHALAEMREIRLSQLFASGGREELLAVVETNYCFSDGIQFVTGCTFGNNGLIYLDFGKTAVTLSDRTGQGIRIAVQADYREYIDGRVPGYKELFDEVIISRNRDHARVRQFEEVSLEASFKLLEVEHTRLFTTTPARAEIPPHAPPTESVLCAGCGESVTGSKTVDREGKRLCIPCAHAQYYRVSGDGISRNTKIPNPN